jgi:hypothetical protein
MSFDDVIALIGLACFLAGIYLWLGLPAALIVLGLALMFVGARVELPRRGGVKHEPD